LASPATAKAGAGSASGLTLARVSEHSYAQLFNSFAAHTDEKLVLASAITQFMENHSLRRVLDVGAGNGALTRLLVDHTSYLCALEPDLTHWATLQTLVSKTCVVQTGDIRNFSWVGCPFDLVLASYLLESVYDGEAWAGIIAQMLALRTPNLGRLLAVTHQAECPLHLYQRAVWAVIGGPPPGIRQGTDAEAYPRMAVLHNSSAGERSEPAPDVEPERL
jgi:SAM-dependent methyltransferase